MGAPDGEVRAWQEGSPGAVVPNMRADTPSPPRGSHQDLACAQPWGPAAGIPSADVPWLGPPTSLEGLPCSSVLSPLFFLSLSLFLFATCLGLP